MRQLRGWCIRNGYVICPFDLALRINLGHISPMQRGSQVDVFAYLDYRKFLSAYYAQKKTEGRGFSYRAFARRAGLKSPNHLKRVIDGERRLTPAMVPRYADALSLQGESARYFRTLVSFNEATVHSDKQRAYEELGGFRGYRKAHRLDFKQKTYHSHWYIPAIRELRMRTDFQSDPVWIANTLRPTISTKEATEAVDVLLELGVFKRDDAGVLQTTDAVLSTGPETTNMHLATFHEQMMLRAIDAISKVPAQERDISSLTCCLGPKGLARVKKRVQEFRRELIAIAIEEEKDGAEVVQIGFQVFPLSTNREKKNA